MRKLSVICLSFVALVALTGNAAAATTKQTLDLKISTNKAGKSPTLTAKFKTFTDDGSKPSPGTNTKVYLPKGMKINSSKFKSCSKSTLESSGATACPSGSKVGSGSATVDASPLVAAPLVATVTAFNGGSGKLELFIQITQGAPTTLVLEGKLKSASGKFGKVLDVNIPKLPVPGDVKISITDFTVKLSGKNYLTNPTTCNKTWAFQGLSAFEDGTKVKEDVTVKCKK